jgi:hypothetical protein
LMVYTGKTGNEYFFEVKNKNKWCKAHIQQ